MLLQTHLNSKLSCYNLQFIKNLKNLLPFIDYFVYDHNTLNIVIKPADLIFVLSFLKLHTNLQYKLLTAITGVDYPDRQKRFEIIYELLSIRYNSRIRVKILINEIQIVSSCFLLFPAAT